MGAPLSCLCILLVFSSSGAFFVDPDQPIIFQNEEQSFGHQVVQLSGRVVVSAPLQRTSINQTGQIYLCDPDSGLCTSLPPPAGTEDGINLSLGLSLAAQEGSSQVLACGPTLQRTCGQNIYVNGRCLQLDLNLVLQHTLPPSLPECGSFALDIVFLIDGSGSVDPSDFDKMLTFVSQVMTSFSNTNAQFALMQYSHQFIIHFDFKRFSAVRDPSVLTADIIQMRDVTKTATAIHRVTKELFVAGRGSRDNAVKLLIVITDGVTYDDTMKLEDSTKEAKQRGIVCFAIGVGNAFEDLNAQNELKTIASSDDKIFKVTDFSALSNFRKTLQDKIFAIEGTQSKDATSFQMEMSQEGFSAILTQDMAILGAVGAYDWSGGILVYTAGQERGIWINATKDQTDMKEAYMGYAIQQVEKDIIAVGAPRYQYMGRVLIYKKNSRNSQWELIAAATGEQIGSYFGSVLGVVKKPLSLLIVGAPAYYSPEAPGGRVYLCPMKDSISRRNYNRLLTIKCPETLQGDSSQFLGHFGSAISVLPDLTGDQLEELAVGAPCEDNYKGAIYIFTGKPGGFKTSYAQRIPGSQLRSDLKFFGKSIHGNQDMTQDGLQDVTVGGEGRVLVMRSRPVVTVDMSMTVQPEVIPFSSYDCSEEKRSSSEITVRTCFVQRLKTLRAKGPISALVNYTLLLDAGRSLTRALFTPQPGARTASGTLMVTRNNQHCSEHNILLPECVEDFLTALRVSLNFALTGTPVLSDDSRTGLSREVLFEKNCGGDMVCRDDLSVTISFSKVAPLVVGESLDINVTISVTNEAEDSFNTRVLIPFPRGLSYRLSLAKSDKKVKVSCDTLEGQSVVNCDVNKPRLRPKTRVDFIVSFHVSTTADLGDTLKMTANVTSDNEGTPTDRMTSSAQLRVLYTIYVIVTSLEESSKYQNFSSNDTTIQHVYRVNNLGERSLPLSIVFLLPVRLGEAAIWENINITSSQPQATNCSMTAQTGGAQNFQELINKRSVVSCSVGPCVRAECKVHRLEAQTSVLFTVSGTVTKDWTTQTEVKKLSLQSSAEIIYDNRTFHQSQHFTRAQAQTILEIHHEYNYIPLIAGSSVGGLVLLALMVAALYKLGFFRRQYKEMLEDSGVGGEGGAETGDGAE